MELSVELCGTRSWGFQSIRELCTEPRKLGGWEAIPLPAMPCGGLWLVDSICDSDTGLLSRVTSHPVPFIQAVSGTHPPRIPMF